MSEFTREQLETLIECRKTSPHYCNTDPADLAAFALAQVERVEDLERTLSTAIKNHLCEVDKRKQAETISAGNLARAEKAEAERDEANDERDDAVDRWARRAREAEATVKDYLTVQAERDRLRAQLGSILANSDSLESGKLADAHAEIARLREKLRAWQEKSDRHESERDSFRLEADRLRAELREAEKRMKAWGCPDYDYVCLNCGRETPCITEADLRPGDPGVPCTFDLTYPQMIERLRHYEDRQRKAEAERDEARAMKVPATTEAVTLAEMGEMVARTEAWAAKEELRAAEAERDRLQRALDLSEQAHREVREVCERHGVENALRLSVRLESVCYERDRLRAQLDSILANSDSLESGKLADAHAEIKRLREELAGAEEAEAACKELLQVQAERDRLREELREAEEAIRLLAWECCEDCGGTGVVWAGPMDDPQQAQCERCWSEGFVPPSPDPFPIGQRMAHPAVRRARERAGRG